jgi:hypothetical protein
MSLEQSKYFVSHAADADIGFAPIRAVTESAAQSCGPDRAVACVAGTATAKHSSDVSVGSGFARFPQFEDLGFGITN